MQFRALIIGVMLLLTACAAGPAEDVGGPTTPPLTTTVASTTSTTSTTDGPTPDFETAPAVRVSSEAKKLVLQPWTACWTMACYDGAPPDDLEAMGPDDELFVDFPVEGWTFQATVRPVGDECGRRQTETLETSGATRHRLPAIGFAGDHVVDLFGSGPGGDVIVSFLWSTASNGIFPVPAATASILADHDGVVDSYGVEFSLWNLATSPTEAAARATVTSESGATHSMDLKVEDFDCSEGSLYFSAPLDEGLAAAALGDGPFTYEVVVTLDGVEHIATAAWPTDEDPECAPCVPLSFSPPLPALGGGLDINANQIDGVWVFTHSPTASNDALLTGVARIDNGCLFIGDHVVIWHTDVIDRAAAAIAGVTAGESPEISVGGSGIGSDEDTTPLPSAVTDHCGTQSVWFGAP